MRVLVVEDDPALRAAIRDGLAGNGFAVDVTDRAEDARRLLRESTFDVIVLDLGLPDEDGMAVLEHLRPHGQSLPVLVLTAPAGLGRRGEGLEPGAGD